jgi:hypothetical protein
MLFFGLPVQECPTIPENWIIMGIDMAKKKAEDTTTVIKNETDYFG